jgi:acetyltransferase-like isoleucine patch superfamily enzyme
MRCLDVASCNSRNRQHPQLETQLAGQSAFTNLKSFMVRSLFKRGMISLSAISASRIHRTSAVESGCQIVDSTIDKHSFCGYDCVILSTKIGSFCSIADRVYIGGSKHPMHFVSTSPVFLSHRDSVKAKFAFHEYYCLPKTIVGNDVWIGFDAKIRAGVSIGTGAVIGMGSVVTKDVAPYSIVAGVPATVIGYRFDPEIIEQLLASRWWEFDENRLREVAKTFCDPVEFLRVLKQS